MRLHILKRWISLRWKNPWVRIIAALTTLIAVTLVQYYLVNIPAPVNVQTVSPRITPAGIASRSQRLLIENPVFSPAGTLASHTGRKYEIVEAHFDRARLSDETLALFHYFEAQIGSAPRDDQTIDFFNCDLASSAMDVKQPCSGDGKLTLQ